MLLARCCDDLDVHVDGATCQLPAQQGAAARGAPTALTRLHLCSDGWRVESMAVTLNTSRYSREPSNSCLCTQRAYDVIFEWDQRGSDVPCGGLPFCKVRRPAEASPCV